MEGNNKQRTPPRVPETNDRACGCCAAVLCPDTWQMREWEQAQVPGSPSGIPCWDCDRAAEAQQRKLMGSCPTTWWVLGWGIKIKRQGENWNQNLSKRFWRSFKTDCHVVNSICLYIVVFQLPQKGHRSRDPRELQSSPYPYYTSSAT